MCKRILKTAIYRTTKEVLVHQFPSEQQLGHQKKMITFLFIYFFPFGPSQSHNATYVTFRVRNRNQMSLICYICLSLREPVLCPFLTPAKLLPPLVEIATWLPKPNPTPNHNPSPTPNPQPTNTRGVVIWQGSELGTTPEQCFHFAHLINTFIVTEHQRAVESLTRTQCRTCSRWLWVIDHALTQQIGSGPFCRL